MMRLQTEYLFGDTQLAAARLNVLHDVFEPTSKALLLEHARPDVVSCRSRVALDVGCGIGCSTDLLRRICGRPTTVGVDTSAAFLKLAAARYRACDFVRADAARSLGVRNPGIVYARYVLCHLGDATAVLASWCSAMPHGGRVLVEENTGYESKNQVLAAYMETASSVMKANGQNLYVGRTLRTWNPPPGFRVVHAGQRQVHVPAARAAALFSMNFPAWRERARAHRKRAWLDSLGRSLEEERDGRSEGAPITWNLLQLVIGRVPPAPR
jgi:SAM-dependent methyltransferase